MPTAKQLQAMRENGRRNGALRKAKGMFNPEAQSRRRSNQLAHEEAMAAALRAEGFTVFSPTVVCDRIAVKDGRVFFVEFKRRGKKLRPGQQRIADLVPAQYLVRYAP